MAFLIAMLYVKSITIGKSRVNIREIVNVSKNISISFLLSNNLATFSFHTTLS